MATAEAVRGSAERALLRQGMRYALWLRLVLVAVSSLASLFLASAPNQAVTVAVVLGLNAWNVLYAFLRLRGTGPWVILVDVAVISGVCLSQVWTVTSDPRAGGTWVLIAMAITLITYPWLVGGRALAVMTVVVVGLHYAGTWLADPGGWLVSEAVVVWTAAEVLLSWGLYRFVRRSAHAADRIVEREENARREAAVAGARRADEREYLAALHDTASATLLMVGAGVVAGRQRWLADQAKRDLREISEPEVAPTADVNLLDLLREVAGHTPLRISWRGAESVRLPAVDAVLLSRGVREALTNVVRHAGTDAAEVHVRLGDDAVTVEVVDSGKGFAADQVPDHRYGVTRSLVERMSRAGGSAEVVSRPGSGTTVRMTCPLRRTEPADDDAKMIGTSFQRGLRWGVVVMSLAILLFLDLPRLLASRDAYLALWPQYVTWLGLLGVTLVVAGATWRNKPLGRWRWPLVAVVFALSVLGAVSVRPEYRLGPAHWSEGDAGWQVVLLMLDSRVVVFAVVLVAQYLMTFGLAALAGQAALTVAGVVNATWAVLTYQLAIAMIAAVLRELAVTSAKVARAEEQLRTAEAVAQQLHQDRKRRYAELGQTTVPLLQGLASGDLDPAAEPVRRSCAVEAARMRRLFAEGSTVADPLLHELRACIETAERLGVPVSFAERGSRPRLPAQVRRRLTEPTIAALSTARGKARVTVAGNSETVTVSVIAECEPPPSTVDSDGVSVSVLRNGARWWIQATWRSHPE
ncbi:ATP-binding protein [Kibdelosporangium persicum]|uniref:Signal transduction histidine kinase n=1 Tax=Kibdelosporangium persicum TaxID=2698649 RepID=A0ABX2FFI0_9PSEU|nr:ATP-binding protein [Kibdelosporangium persicum]NRN69586.1 Signal transduction histidine kinase [Kibdelosporangium persicum]